ncbi:MAG: GtrA family protein [Christensenella sp.]|nr:GtrA family protein [Christensenella sp.]
MRTSGRNTHFRDDRRLFFQALRYGLAAFGGFAADYLTLLMLKEWAQMHYLAAVPAAFLVGLVVNYLIGRWLVFPRAGMGLHRELLIFAAISLLALAVTEGSMFCLTDLAGLDYRISRVLSGVITYLFNFFARRIILYSKTQRGGREEADIGKP